MALIGIPLAGADGDGAPVIADDRIIFNGPAGAGCEPFQVHRCEKDRHGRATTWSFCKTGRAPYDLCVQVALIVLRHHRVGDLLNPQPLMMLARPMRTVVVHQAQTQQELRHLVTYPSCSRDRRVRCSAADGVAEAMCPVPLGRRIALIRKLCMEPSAPKFDKVGGGGPKSAGKLSQKLSQNAEPGSE